MIFEKIFFLLTTSKVKLLNVENSLVLNKNIPLNPLIIQYHLFSNNIMIDIFLLFLVSLHFL